MRQPDQESRTIQRCRGVIERVAGKVIQEKKRKIAEAEERGKSYDGRDLLTLLRKFPTRVSVRSETQLRSCIVKSNQATDLPPSQRISDEDILNNINTLMFAGSDTTSLSITWTLMLLAIHPDFQSKLRTECLSVLPSTPLSSLTEEEINSLYAIISDLPYLDKVVKESLRLIPPLHSSIRVATKDDVIPTSSPIKRKMPDGSIVEDWDGVPVKKGSFVHVAVEGFNMDKEFWGEDAWQFV